MTPAQTRRELLVLFGAIASGCAAATETKATTEGCAEPSDAEGKPYCLAESLVVRVADGASLAVGESVLFNVDDDTAVIVVRDAAGFYARSAVCTHACCLVAICSDDACTDISPTPGACLPTMRGTAKALCPCHGSVFRLDDGQPINGPATTPLPAYAVLLDGQDVLVDTGVQVSFAERRAT